MNVFTQGVIWKTVNLIGNTRVIITNRINHVNLQASASLKKDTKEKLKSLPEKPKKPLNPYLRFVKENRETFVRSNPDLPQPQIIKKAAEEWKKIDKAKKEKYAEDYHKESAIYNENIAKYNLELSKEQKDILSAASEEKKKQKEKRALRKLCKETGKPKMPLPPFFRYMMEQHKTSNKNIVDLATGLKPKWAALTPEEKQKYELEYKKDREQYEKELGKWEVQMIKKGNFDLVREKTLKNTVSVKAFHEIKQKRSQ